MRKRLIELDSFRAIDIIFMIFGNHNMYIGGTSLPSWTVHAQAHSNQMSFVDLMFPGFLFAVGVSIPIVFSNHLEENISPNKTFFYFTKRCIIMLILGLLMVNIEILYQNIENKNLYPFFSLILLISLAYTINTKFIKHSKNLIMLAFFICLFYILIALPSLEFKKIGFYYLGILGLIGIAHFICWNMVLFFSKLNFKKTILSLVSLCLTSIAFNFFSHYSSQKILQEISIHITHATIEYSGILIGILMLKKEKPINMKIIFLVIATSFLFLAMLTNKLIPVSKIYATFPWAAYSIGICSICLLILHTFKSKLNKSFISNLLETISKNSLACFIIPVTIYFLFDYFNIKHLLISITNNDFYLLFFQSVIFTSLITYLIYYLGKKNIFFKL